MAAGTTYLDIVNKVLLRLREEEVATVGETAYSQLIGSFVNVVKNEVEGAWPWFDLRESYTVNTVAGTTSYALTSCTAKANPLDVWNLTEKWEMERIQWREMNRNVYAWGLDTPTRAIPFQWCPNGTNGSDNYQVLVYPVPDAAYQLQFNMYVPTAPLSAGTDRYYGPLEPMVEGVLAYAYKERGEDGGMSSKEQFQIYHDMLALAVSREQGQSENDTLWTTGV
jgi:hypothetical protein